MNATGRCDDRRLSLLLGRVSLTCWPADGQKTGRPKMDTAEGKSAPLPPARAMGNAETEVK